MATDGKKDRELPMKKPSIRREQLSLSPSFMGTDEPTDQLQGEPRENSCECVADRLSRKISQVETWHVVPPSFSGRRHGTCAFLFLSVRSQNNTPANIFPDYNSVINA